MVTGGPGKGMDMEGMVNLDQLGAVPPSIEGVDVSQMDAQIRKLLETGKVDSI